MRRFFMPQVGLRLASLSYTTEPDIPDYTHTNQLALIKGHLNDILAS